MCETLLKETEAIMSKPAPFFTTVTSFNEVPVEDGVDTTEFIKASEGLVQLFGILHCHIQ